MLHKPLLPRQQQGQVMVEYAIILILSITLLIGGIEMAATAFASSKASDGAKAGANEFAEVNEKRLAAQNSQNDYLRALDGLLFNGDPRKPSTVNADGEFDADGEFNNYVEYIDSITDANNNGSIEDELQELMDDQIVGQTGTLSTHIVEIPTDLVTDTDPANVTTDSAKDFFGDPLPTGLDGDTNEEISKQEVIDFINNKLDDLAALDIDADGNITSEELGSFLIDLDGNGVINEFEAYFEKEFINKPARAANYQNKIIQEQIKLSRLPLNPEVALSQSTPLIGNHDGTLMTNPSCGAGNTYNTGLPDNNDDGVPDTEWPAGSGVYVPAIYLFNPKPINVASCAGVDPTRGSSRLSILVGGSGREGQPGYVKGLPKLNQAMYGQYVNVCLDGANQYVSCSSGAVAQTLLKPPGKLCLSNAASPTVDSCSIDAPATGTTGYYFWGQTNDSAGDAFAYTNDEPIEFRPTFQLVCNGNSAKSPLLMDTDCLDSESLATVQINTRYRSVFESFLTFGLLELQDANLAQYFYDPSNLRSLGTNLGVGIAGSELGPKRQNGNPTVKPFKDFRGCYEVNVETNQVSACN